MRYHFSDYVLDIDRRELRRGLELVYIAPQVFDLLAYLISQRHRVVSKDDLIDVIWSRRAITDAALSTRINIVRRAIGDSGERQSLVRTLPRKGLRFVGEVQEEAIADIMPPNGGFSSSLPLPDKPSIAVLPFTNMSDDPAQEYLADGIADDITTELSRFSELFVIARNSSFQYKGRSVDVREIGRDLGVRYVLEGSVQKAAKRVRVAAQLVDAMTGARRWGERYDRDLEEVFAVRDEVVRTIATILVAQVNKAELERTLNSPPVKWQAHDYYLRAADELNTRYRLLTVEGIYRARHFIERSIATDPNYARSLALLAFTYTMTWSQPFDSDYLSPKALDHAHHLSKRALQIEPNLPQAHASLGWVLTWKHQQDAAVAAFERAVALNPNYMDWRFAAALIYAGEFDRAIEVATASKRLDPYYVPFVLGWMGSAHYMLRNYQQALQLLGECVSQAPNWRRGHLWLAATFAQLGLLDEARIEAEAFLMIEPNWTIDGTSRQINGFKHAEHAEHFFDGLRKTGLPIR